jgi:hypothetical protein
VYDPADLISIPKPNSIPEIIGHDSQMIAMIPHVGREGCVSTPSPDDLLAPPRGLPIHFHIESIGTEQALVGCRTLTDPGEEQHGSMRETPVALERAVRPQG